jgi:hypothetical protein
MVETTLTAAEKNVIAACTKRSRAISNTVYEAARRAFEGPAIFSNPKRDFAVQTAAILNAQCITEELGKLAAPSIPAAPPADVQEGQEAQR